MSTMSAAVAEKEPENMPGNIPGTILVGSVTYTVTADPDAWVRYEHANKRSGFAGHTEHATAVIYLNPDLAPEVTRLTLWHEVMHALCYTVMGAPDWHHLGKEKSDREEAVVAAFESPIVCVLRDNPDLVDYLTAR